MPSQQLTITSLKDQYKPQTVESSTLELSARPSRKMKKQKSKRKTLDLEKHLVKIKPYMNNKT